MSDVADGFTLPLVKDLIAMPEFTAGDPEVMATPHALEAPVRWAHVVAGVSAPGLLDGQELVLTTGSGWPESGPALTRLLHELCDAGISALVFETGTRYVEVPAEVREVFAEREVALVVLHREVKFVQITQRIHRLILGAQNEALQAKQHVHTLFTDLGLNRSPVDYMVEQMAATMGSPIVLENTAGQVVAWSAPDTATDAREVLAHWSLGMFVPPSPTSLNLPDGHEALTRVPVEAQGTRWGTLTALPGPSHPAGRHTVLELGAIALALGRLADDSDEWLRLSAKQLFDSLLGGRYRTDTDLEVQLAAAGLPFERRTLFGMSLTGRGTFGSHASLEKAVLETALRRAIAPEGRAILAESDDDTHGTALLALVSLPTDDERITAPHSTVTDPPLATRLARELEMLVPGTTPRSWRAHLSLGVTTGDTRSPASVRGLLTSIEGVIAAGILPSSSTTGRVTTQEATRQPLTYLLRDLSGSPALQRYVDDVLGPLIEHDRLVGPGHSGDLLRVLGAYLAHPTNRSHAATQARLSRSVFYQRLELIEDLLAVDLADGVTITTLSVALMAHGIHS